MVVENTKMRQPLRQRSQHKPGRKAERRAKTLEENRKNRAMAAGNARTQQLLRQRSHHKPGRKAERRAEVLEESRGSQAMATENAETQQPLRRRPQHKPGRKAKQQAEVRQAKREPGRGREVDQAKQERDLKVHWSMDMSVRLLSLD